MPEPDSRVWLENLPTGPAETRAVEIRGRALRVDPPAQSGREIPLATGTEVALAYAHAQVPCEARATVIRTPEGFDGGPWLDVHHVDRVQRREAVRVPVLLMARIRDDAAGEPQPEAAVTEDLSANGVLVRLARPVQVGQTLELVVHLGGAAGDLRAAARVVRVDFDENAARQWRAALTFPDLGRQTEDRVVRFLFQRQRELRRRAEGL